MSALAYKTVLIKRANTLLDTQIDSGRDTLNVLIEVIKDTSPAKLKEAANTAKLRKQKSKEAEMKVNVKKLNKDAIVPTYATDGSGCFDLYSIDEKVIIENTPIVFGTGLAFEIPKGHVMMVYSRSGHGFKNLVRLANCVGVIDSDYRGEVKVKLYMDSRIGTDEGSLLSIKRGDRIAQACIIPVPKVEFNEVNGLSKTSRGSGGFGSTGE